MAKTYFIIDAHGVEKGPVALNLIKKNGINHDTMVWFYGLPFWVKAKTIPEFVKHLREIGIESKEDLPALNKTNDRHKESILKNIYANDSEKEQIAAATQPKSWMLRSILVTIFCFFPFGIMGIINSARISTLWQSERYAESLEASEQAKWWTKWGFLIALLFWASWGLYLILFPSASKTIGYIIENLSNSLYTD
ncbi:MAG: CD225/dispanin family protein [Rikenellaceae bacterium]